MTNQELMTLCAKHFRSTGTDAQTGKASQDQDMVRELVHGVLVQSTPGTSDVADEPSSLNLAATAHRKSVSLGSFTRPKNDSSFRPPIEMAFLPRWHKTKPTYVQRMHVETSAKVALAVPLKAWCSDSDSERVFVEDGSTPALASLGAVRSRRWRRGQNKICLVTNMPFIHSVFHGCKAIDPHLVYADQAFNQKYGGTFPISSRTLNAAHSCKDNARRLRAKERSHEAWNQLLSDGWRFDRSIMTASKFHFAVGPFVGSVENALLKAAYLITGRRVALLIDGSKLLSNDQLWDEWSRKNCYQVIANASRIHEGFASRYIKQVFNMPRDVAPSEEQLHTVLDANGRNPYVRLNLPGRILRSDERWGQEEIKLPQTWGDCLEAIHNRGREMSIFVSQPLVESPEAFELRLSMCIQEANTAFGKMQSAVRIDTPRPTSTIVDLGGFYATNQPQVSEIVVWECPIAAVKGDDRTIGRETATNSMSFAD